MSGLIRGMARTAVVAGTATAVSNRVSRRQAERWSAQDAQQYQDTTPADNTDSQMQQLQQLGDLKARGILTEEEFQAKKQQILGI
jgi:hypothetical protein